jgi:hypothetical protein
MKLQFLSQRVEDGRLDENGRKLFVHSPSPVNVISLAAIFEGGHKLLINQSRITFKPPKVLQAESEEFYVRDIYINPSTNYRSKESNDGGFHGVFRLG